MSTLEKVSPIGSLSHRMDAREQKTINVSGGDQGNAKLPRSQNPKLCSDPWYPEQPMSQNIVGGQPIGVRTSQYERALFSSSLSDLFAQKMRLQSNDFSLRQSGSRVDSRWDKALPEAEARMLKNILPDEEELFSGMVDETGYGANASGVADDLDDLDLFSSSGGIELEGDESWAEKRSMAFSARGISGNANFAGHHASRMSPSIRAPNASAVSHQLGQEGSANSNNFYSPVGMTPPGPGSQFGSYEQLKLENFPIPNFHPHSLPEFHGGLSNGIPQAQSPSQIADMSDMYARVTERMGHDMHPVGSNGRDMELNKGTFAYSSNGNHFYAPHQSLASGPSSYEHHPLRNFYNPSVAPFVNGEHPRHAVQLPGFPRGQHLMMDMISSTDPAQHPVGSAPVINASQWDRLMHAGLSPEASTFHARAVKNGQIPGMHPLAYNMYPQANGTSIDVTKSNGLQSPQQMSHVLPRRSTMSSSFGSPMDRVRNRRYEASTNYADRKHYELKIDRILRGEDNRTTLMIKNIPNKYTSKMLLATIDEQHRGMYDFIYLPIDFKNKCNVGYAFINMVNPLHVVSFHQTFEGKKWEKFNSEKVATLAYARIQGKTALIAHFQNSSLMNEDKRCRPILFHTVGPNAGDQEPFPMGSNIRSRPGKPRTHGGDEEFEIKGQLKSWSSSGGADEASDETDY